MKVQLGWFVRLKSKGETQEESKGYSCMKKCKWQTNDASTNDCTYKRQCCINDRIFLLLVLLKLCKKRCRIEISCRFWSTLLVDDILIHWGIHGYFKRVISLAYAFIIRNNCQIFLFGYLDFLHRRNQWSRFGYWLVRLIDFQSG